MVKRIPKFPSASSAVAAPSLAKVAKALVGKAKLIYLITPVFGFGAGQLSRSEALGGAAWESRERPLAEALDHVPRFARASPRLRLDRSSLCVAGRRYEGSLEIVTGTERRHIQTNGTRCAILQYIDLAMFF